MPKTPAKARSKRSTSKPAGRRPKAGAEDYRAKIRMYRHGLGDCFLITLPRTNPTKERPDFFIMIDCGVILGTKDPALRMTEVLSDVAETTNHVVDLLVVTHEHWDHVSGFVQAAQAFKDLTVNAVWLAWTEDPEDELAKELRQDRDKALAALQLGLTHLQLGGDAQTAGDVGGLLEFFGAKGSSTRDALDAVATKVEQPRYCRPSDSPVSLADAGVTVYVMGPPQDRKALRKINPSKRNPETYGPALSNLDLFLDGAASGLDDDIESHPFGTLFEIPLPVAREMDFFKKVYWRPGTTDQDWRRIDTAWLMGASELALQLDSLTNNTSLVLAIELPGEEVLLFVADAQVGNWLSWQDLKWPAHEVTGPNLLERAIFYKVGHHGSHNATLKEAGLQQMKNLRVAMIPVNEDMAKKKRWNHMPLTELVAALSKQASGAVIRADRDLPSTHERVEPGPHSEAFSGPRYYEVTF